MSPASTKKRQRPSLFKSSCSALGAQSHVTQALLVHIKTKTGAPNTIYVLLSQKTNLLLFARILWRGGELEMSQEPLSDIRSTGSHPFWLRLG